MFDIPAMTWTLTAVLLLGGTYHLLQTVRSRHLTARVNNTLHALMNTLMAAMLWNVLPSTMLAQIALLAGAALWFIIQAIARPEFKILCVSTQGRLKCLYHSLTMAAAALMIAMMARTTGHAQADGTPMAMPMPAAHHTMTSAPHNSAAATSTGTTTFDHLPALAIPLTVLFGAAAVIFLVLLLRHRTAKTTSRHMATPRHFTRSEHALEALGAAIMALMFATMTA
ncbi:DUF5134 domain-containing protein [Paenarthrobacter sp. PH39-S1]|uniref:DUF5134 domain-containing protein n=1 Tax=Paenarthrobacter sp. PH39-S1 TaxID=3046204 RepID=UPI0024BAB45E|nr:DUF5134 domain-containing protein [Paenarthrobacter sp. PH39-S1]MDJ0358501.1 DUF5134 domain-containing protein [Paenarthrobacter sp. PH39-S1]